ncbi:MAG: hypothetical protein JXA98_04510 [Methanosarcinaceae archaeon]|nr:hypothetical protein [Methanosarcinaceae archaeon]
MDNNWVNALKKYNWTVNLQQFVDASIYKGYFDRTIRPDDVVIFENRFRRAINNGSSFEIAGEVCFWKNYGNPQSRNRITTNLLSYHKEKTNWENFVRVVKEISDNPSSDKFVSLKRACNQQNGFATPITFLAFYNPIEFPMVDKHIANWWIKHKETYGFRDFPDFSQRKNDDWIKSNNDNWNAYIAWKTFCCDYAKKIARNYGLNWRARDVEMAVWEAQKNGISLEVLQ